jgi:hypothetical protein
VTRDAYSSKPGKFYSLYQQTVQLYNKINVSTVIFAIDILHSSLKSMNWLCLKIKKAHCSREVSQKSGNVILVIFVLFFSFVIRSRSEVKAYKKIYDGPFIYEFVLYGRTFWTVSSLPSHLIFISFTLHPILIYKINNILHGPDFPFYFAGL